MLARLDKVIGIVVIFLVMIAMVGCVSQTSRSIISTMTSKLGVMVGDLNVFPSVLITTRRVATIARGGSLTSSSGSGTASGEGTPTLSHAETCGAHDFASASD